MHQLPGSHAGPQCSHLIRWRPRHRGNQRSGEEHLGEGMVIGGKFARLVRSVESEKGGANPDEGDEPDQIVPDWVCGAWCVAGLPLIVKNSDGIDY